MSRKTNKKSGVNKLKTLLPKKKSFIMFMPEEKDEGIHWLFWVLIFLVVLFLASLVFLSWQQSSALLSYIN